MYINLVRRPNFKCYNYFGAIAKIPLSAPKDFGAVAKKTLDAPKGSSLASFGAIARKGHRNLSAS